METSREFEKELTRKNKDKNNKVSEGTGGGRDGCWGGERGTGCTGGEAGGQAGWHMEGEGETQPEELRGRGDS
eukprot:1452826-Rhodomonas_salina.1